MAHPAVILDHTDYIKSVQCRGHDLEIIFTDHEAFAFAQTAWAKEKDFLLATFTIGCGSSTEQRTFWLVDHFVTGRCDTCITAVVEREVPFEEAVHGSDIFWGTYTPLEDPPKVRRSELLERQVPGNNNSATGACGPAPSDRIDGLPTANCGSPTFDQDLDDKIGYLHFDADDYSRSLEKFVPGLDDFDPADNEGFGVLQNANTTRLTRHQKGGWFGDRVAKVCIYYAYPGIERPYRLTYSLGSCCYLQQSCREAERAPSRGYSSCYKSCYTGRQRSVDFP